MELDKNDVNDKDDLGPNDSTTITDRSTHDTCITKPHDAVAGPIGPLEAVYTHSMEEQSSETCPDNEDINDNTSNHGNITTDTIEDDRVKTADSASTSVSDSRVNSAVSESRVNSEMIVEPETCRENMKINDNTENMVDNQQCMVVHSENTRLD